MKKFFGQGVIVGLFFLLHFTTLSFTGFRFGSCCFAETNVGGSIRGNTVWTVDKSLYILKSSIVVVSDATLTSAMINNSRSSVSSVPSGEEGMVCGR